MYLAMYRARDYSRLKLQKRGLRRTVVHVYASATRELRQLSYVTIIFEKRTSPTYVSFKILRRFVWHTYGEPLRSHENGTTPYHTTLSYGYVRRDAGRCHYLYW